MPTRVMTFTLALGLFFTALAAQQPAKIPRVGLLSPADPMSPLFEAFRQGLADLGYVEGKNVVIVPRFAKGQYDQFPGLVADLVREKVDVLAVQGAVTVRAARKAAPDIPIVFAVVVDPVKDDLVTNAERPGGNITGITTFDPQQPRKQLELLRQVVPGLKRVALLGDAGVSDAPMRACDEQARAMGLETLRLLLTAPNPDLDGAFAAMRKEHVDALLVLEVPVTGTYLKEIAQHAAGNRIPSLASPSRSDLGQLLAYGTSFSDGIRRMAVYVDKVLKGAKAGDLAVETFTRYKLIVNLKTAQEIGLTIPPEVLQKADRVIQ
jgi:putative tryptophan/tyrosine transport system substrate-binding protein